MQYQNHSLLGLVARKGHALFITHS